MARMLDREALRLLNRIGGSIEQWILDKAVAAPSRSDDELIDCDDILEAFENFLESGVKEVSSKFIGQEEKQNPTLRAG